MTSNSASSCILIRETLSAPAQKMRKKLLEGWKNSLVVNWLSALWRTNSVVGALVSPRAQRQEVPDGDRHESCCGQVEKLHSAQAGDRSESVLSGLETWRHATATSGAG
jgi:hypothetical protein